MAENPTAIDSGTRSACQTCGKTEMESKRVFAHEEWEYETTCSPAVAHLEDLVLSCWHRHAVEHFGATGNMVLSGEVKPQAIEDTIEHFCRVNQVGRGASDAHRAEARAKWTRLSKLEWTVDWGAFGVLVASEAPDSNAAFGPSHHNRNS
jgi:hypothetical protein